MVDAQSGLRASFPAGVLLLFGVLMATLGPGKIRWTPGGQAQARNDCYPIPSEEVIT
jgi:hypothetical protein